MTSFSNIPKYSRRAYYIIDGIQDIKIYNEKYELEIKWLGFKDADSTWEPFGQLEEDAAEEAPDFLPLQENAI